MKLENFSQVSNLIDKLKSCQSDISSMHYSPQLIQISINAKHHFTGSVKKAAIEAMLKQLRAEESALISELNALGVTGVYMYETK